MNPSPLPTGTVTFLFTDIVGSTPLWEQQSEAMSKSLDLHNALLAQAVAAFDGHWFKVVGDSLQVAFSDPLQALMAALEGQSLLAKAAWGSTGPLQVRMGIHTGHAVAMETDYATTHTLNRVARIMSAAYGGQILLSQEVHNAITYRLPETMSLMDLGMHRMKGMSRLEHLYQVLAPDLAVEFPPIQSLEAFKHNLPRQLSTFVGREKELADVSRLLQETQLLTLLGPGGTGKTRLMLQAAEEIIEGYPDGVWLVELASLTDPGLISERVAAALNVQEQPGREMLATLTDYLRRKELLLLLDNVEHLVQASAALAEHILENCPKLKILVTGREALFIGGETTLQIPSLSLPQDTNKPVEIAAAEGVQLFLERARSVRPDFELHEQNAGTVAEIVRRLDGIPLALELAAARLRMLTVEQIAARLNDRFRLLTGGSRTALPRQQTLQALIDWSWNLLDEPECVLLQRLSVFSGGFTLEAAQAVTGFEPLDELSVFDGLEQLINKSLVLMRQVGEGSARYHLLESIRQYTQVKLFEAGEGEAMRNRHTDYFAGFAREYLQQMFKADALHWIRKIVLEVDNVRSALDWTRESRPEIALQIAGSLLYGNAFWITPREAIRWLEPVIAKTRPEVVRGGSEIDKADFVRALISLGNAYFMEGIVEPLVELGEESINLAREIGVSYLLIAAMQMRYAEGVPSSKVSAEVEVEIESLLLASLEKEDYFEIIPIKLLQAELMRKKGMRQEFQHFRDEVIRLSKKIDDSPLLQSMISAIQADQSLHDKSFAEAKSYFRQNIELEEAIGNFRYANVSRSRLGHLHRQLGELQEAETTYRKTILVWQEQGYFPAVAHQVECFAYLALAKDQYERAARLLGAAQQARVELNAPLRIAWEIEEYEQALEHLAEHLGEDELNRLKEEGARMDLEEGVLFALGK